MQCHGLRIQPHRNVQYSMLLSTLRIRSYYATGTWIYTYKCSMRPANQNHSMTSQHKIRSKYIAIMIIVVYWIPFQFPPQTTTITLVILYTYSNGTMQRWWFSVIILKLPNVAYVVSILLSYDILLWCGPTFIAWIWICAGCCWLDAVLHNTHTEYPPPQNAVVWTFWLLQCYIHG